MPFNSKEKYNEWKRKQYLKNREAELARKKQYHATGEGKAVLYKSVSKYRKADPEKQKARWLLQRAVALGKIKRLVCEVCGANKSQAHHDDYSKPYGVRWLCSTHHGEVHRRSTKVN